MTRAAPKLPSSPAPPRHTAPRSVPEGVRRECGAPRAHPGRPLPSCRLRKRGRSRERGQGEASFLGSTGKWGTKGYCRWRGAPRPRGHRGCVVTQKGELRGQSSTPSLTWGVLEPSVEKRDAARRRAPISINPEGRVWRPHPPGFPKRGQGLRERGCGMGDGVWSVRAASPSQGHGSSRLRLFVNRGGPQAGDTDCPISSMLSEGIWPAGHPVPSCPSWEISPGPGDSADPHLPAWLRRPEWEEEWTFRVGESGSWLPAGCSGPAPPRGPGGPAPPRAPPPRAPAPSGPAPFGPRPSGPAPPQAPPVAFLRPSTLLHA